jgi:hypothetical protein
MATENMLVERDSHERVAFDLMLRIESTADNEPEKKDRAYYLALYRQCYKAVHGWTLERTFEEEKPSQ